MWSGLGQAATVAQLVGADVGGLISMIMQAALTAQQNKKECEQLARRVFMIAELLPHLQDPEVMPRPEVRRPLAGLGDTLREAHELVMSCQGMTMVYRLVTAGRQADKFRDVQSKIDSYLLVFPFISHIYITRRLDRIYNILLPNDMSTMPSPSSGSHSHEVELQAKVVLHGDEGEKFTFAELAAATNNFADDREIGKGGFGTVYIGYLLSDGREVAIKRMHKDEMHGTMAKEFLAEVAILPSLRHEHIICLYGSCVLEHEKRQLLPPFRKIKMVEERLIVYEYTKNGSLHDHLHGTPPWPSSSSSPVRASWKMRIETLLGVSRAIEYLQCYNERPVIHRDINSSNILFDATWAPRLADFGASVRCDPSTRSVRPDAIYGTFGYIDLECAMSVIAKPTIDVYSFGVVMLEVLTGMRALFYQEEDVHKVFNCWEDPNTIPAILAEVTLPFIEVGEVWKVMDRRLTPEPTARQLEAADLVAQTAARCVRLRGEDRPAISEVVANLEAALELARRDG
uniref:Protein kinase domain-containing protein n=1 Tax=Oryza punctata TaxID=4537 RepID=A0A0E0MHY8_ORYPU